MGADGGADAGTRCAPCRWGEWGCIAGKNRGLEMGDDTYVHAPVIPATATAKSRCSPLADSFCDAAELSAGAGSGRPR